MTHEHNTLDHFAKRREPNPIREVVNDIWERLVDLDVRDSADPRWQAANELRTKLSKLAPDDRFGQDRLLSEANSLLESLMKANIFVPKNEV